MGYSMYGSTVNSSGRWFLWTLFLIVQGISAIGTGQSQDENFFSGPQADESLPGFEIRKVFAPAAGTLFDPTRSDWPFETDLKNPRSGTRPVLLVFVHDVNRQTISMTRTLTTYAHSRQSDLATCVILLDSDQGHAEQTLNRIKHALTEGVVTGISVDGIEGPGALGLNRKSSLTIILADQGKVVANFALIQPSLQTDLLKIVEQIVKRIGGTVPKLEQLIAAGNPGMAMDGRGGDASMQEELRGLMRPLIQKDATEAQVDQAAEAIVKRMQGDERARREVHRIAMTIVNSGKLDQYGTERCREYLRKWADDARDK